MLKGIEWRIGKGGEPATDAKTRKFRAAWEDGRSAALVPNGPVFRAQFPTLPLIFFFIYGTVKY